MRRLVRGISLGSLSVLALAAMAVPLGLGGPDLAAGDTATFPDAGVLRLASNVRSLKFSGGGGVPAGTQALTFAKPCGLSTTPTYASLTGSSSGSTPSAASVGSHDWALGVCAKPGDEQHGRGAGRRVAAAGAHDEAGRVARRQGDRVGRARHRVQVQGQGGGAAVPRRRPRDDAAARRHEGPLLGRRRQHPLGDRPIRSEPVGHRLRRLHRPGGPVRRAPPAGGGGCVLPGVRLRRDGSGRRGQGAQHQGVAVPPHRLRGRPRLWRRRDRGGQRDQPQRHLHPPRHQRSGLQHVDPVLAHVGGRHAQSHHDAHQTDGDGGAVHHRDRLGSRDGAVPADPDYDDRLPQRQRAPAGPVVRRYCRRPPTLPAGQSAGASPSSRPSPSVAG